MSFKSSLLSSGGSRDPLNFLILAKFRRVASIQWIPAFAGMTDRGGYGLHDAGPGVAPPVAAGDGRAVDRARCRDRTGLHVAVAHLRYSVAECRQQSLARVALLDEKKPVLAAPARPADRLSEVDAFDHQSRYDLQQGLYLPVGAGRRQGDRAARRAALVVAQNPDVAARFGRLARVTVEPNAALDGLPARVPTDVPTARVAVFAARLLAWKGMEK